MVTIFKFLSHMKGRDVLCANGFYCSIFNVQYFWTVLFIYLFDLGFELSKQASTRAKVSSARSRDFV